MKIPPELILAFEESCEGLSFGKVKLEAVFHDCIPRFVLTKERSYIPGKITSGSGMAGGDHDA